MKKYSLVYQYGIASVFEGRKRLMLGENSSCEYFCRGLIEGGHSVEVMHCDMLGDVALHQWNEGAGTIYSDRKSKL
jgi:hypothetical protein